MTIVCPLVVTTVLGKKYLCKTQTKIWMECSLVDICRTRGFDVATLDAIIVPYRDQCADAVLSIAVLHHLSTLEHRLCAIRELVRILRINGVGLLYAWAQEQEQVLPILIIYSFNRSVK